MNRIDAQALAEKWYSAISSGSMASIPPDIAMLVKQKIAAGEPKSITISGLTRLIVMNS